MPTDTEIWDAAWGRVSGWKHGQVCKGCFFTPHESKEAVRNARWENGTAHHVDHEIPAPAIGDPAAVVKLIDYWRHHSTTRPTWLDWDNWKIELAAAVLAVPQETQP